MKISNPTKLNITTLQYVFGTVEIYDNYLITIMHEGITVIPEYNKDLLEISRTYFKNRPFGYISYRKNSYAVDPRVYIETSKIENLMAFAVVSTHEINISNVEIEKIFLKKPFHLFDALSEAKAWVDKMVNEAD
ncbi:MAG: hypothetical protein OQJ79_12435 [Altibacter sp.]|nr:hypothetical protein [Altibacter sp.]